MEEALAKLDTLCSRLEGLLTERERPAEKRPNPYAKLRETYPNAGKPWNPTDDDELRQLFHEGKLVEDLAVRFGRTTNGIRQRLERLGVAAAPVTVGGVC